MEIFELEAALQLQKDNNQASVFGFILYTSIHSNIVKVLKDDDYWQGFDELSEGWIIYSIKPLQGTKRIKGSSNGFSFLVSIWDEPNRNKQMLEKFEIKSTEDLPLFVIFKIMSETELEKVTYRLSDDSIDNARNSIQGIIETVSSTIQRLSPEYRQTDGAFREVKKSMDEKVFWEKFRKLGKLVDRFRGVTAI